MKQIKALVIPYDTAQPVYTLGLPADKLDEAVSFLIFGRDDGPVGTGRWTATRTVLAFDETAGDRDDRDEIINPRANQLWDHLQGKAHPADEEVLYGHFIAYGFDINTREPADVRDAIADFRFEAG